MSNPVQAFIDTFAGAGPQTQSASLTFSFAITQEFEAFVPVEVLTPANVSAGAVVIAYRSANGGNNFETEGRIIGAFPADGGSTMRKHVFLSTGQYLVSVLTGGGSAATWSIGFATTAWAISAYE